MKTNFKRIIAMLLAVILVVGLSACGGKKKDKEEVTNAPIDKAALSTSFGNRLIAEKVGMISRDGYATQEAGLTYTENGKIGIISYEGLVDSGAIYASVDQEENYFIVRRTLPSSEFDIAGLNAAQLVDCYGKVIIPGTFAAFEILSDRYVLAATAVQRIFNEESALIAYNPKEGTTKASAYMFDIADDAWYSGVWQVYDITTGLPVPGATADFKTTVNAKGRYLTIKDQAGNYVNINEKGEAMPDYASVFDNGTYKIEGKIGDVYDQFGTKLFSYDLTGYQPKYSYGDYYSASKYTDKYTYAVMNNKGEVLSENYAESVEIYGELVFCEGKIYNLKGENIISGTYDSVTYDELLGNNWILRKGDVYTMIDAKGNIYYNGGGDGVTVWTDYFLASKRVNNEYYCYSFQDKDYTVKGTAFGPWIIKTDNANMMYNLVDAMTGETILEGYNRYTSVPLNAYAYYVYAEFNGGADVYLMVSANHIEDVVDKKTNLNDDLSKAFEEAGISVTVDKINGEIALDTSILFGGDSAELTAEGKAILNTFIQTYANVIYSEKYSGFITKTLVEGHTAPLAGSTYASGYALSVERATNVMNYCLSPEAGMDPSSPMATTMEAVGYSNSQPIYDENGEVNLEASRRVSFRFLVSVEF